MNLDRRLDELKIALPEPPQPLGAYVPAVVAGGLLFLSGMLPLRNGRPAFVGRIGVELTLEEGREAARLAALNAVAVARSAAGAPDRIKRLAKLVAHIASAPDFGDHARVADAASEVFTSLFHGRGGHVRVAVGAVSLPAHVPIELELVFELS